METRLASIEAVEPSMGLVHAPIEVVEYSV